MTGTLSRLSLYGLGLLMMLLSAAQAASAGIPVTVPEIDGSSVSMGLGFLAAGALILRARRRK